jgi:hypothetical protein
VIANQVAGLFASPVPPIPPGDYESIQTVTLSGTQATISFTSIPSTYKHLQIRATAQGNRATYGDDNFKLVINSDTGSNYSEHWLRGDGSSASTLSGASQTSMKSGALGTTTGGTFSGSVIDILDYANTSKYKTVRYLSGIDVNGTIAGYGGSIYLGSGLWMSTSAITRLDFTPLNASNFTQYTKFALYGVK